MDKKELKLLKKVSKMKHKTMGERIHQLIKEINPQLEPSSMYGMPAYRHPTTGKIVCFFRSDQYFTFGLTEHAKFLTNDHPLSKLHGSSWFIEELNEEVERELRDILNLAIT